MADTQDDIEVTSAEFKDIKGAITLANTIDIQNKSGHMLIVDITASKPGDNDTDGYYVPPNEILTVTNIAGLFARFATGGSGQVMVRDTG